MTSSVDGLFNYYIDCSVDAVLLSYIIRLFYSGLEYIEESLNETRTAPNFYCKLCDCSFTDPHAKVMHTKGRRHRLQYKVCNEERLFS